jgi:hypothetical protein
MTIPSVKSLKIIAGDKAPQLRKLLEVKKTNNLHAIIDNFPATAKWLNSCYNPPSFHELKMSMADELLGTSGVEYISRGKNKRSPAIEYCNAGDPYTSTLMFVNGSYRVGTWGDIVERGNYD